MKRKKISDGKHKAIFTFLAFSVKMIGVSFFEDKKVFPACFEVCVSENILIDCMQNTQF